MAWRFHFPPRKYDFRWYNGRHGCSFCTQEGQVATQGSGFSSIYPLEILIPPFRTVQQTVCDATIATQTGKAENGVKATLYFGDHSI